MPYTKLEILTEIFDIEDIKSKMSRNIKVSPALLLEVLARDGYKLSRDLGVTDNSVSKLVKKLWPDKKRSTLKVCNYLFHKYGYKYCSSCSFIYSQEHFSSNKSRIDGLSAYCKQCQAVAELPFAAAKTAKYRASKIQRTPVWLSTDEVKQIDSFYKNCPEGYQVDHILPLQGELISGLHVLSNLQYLPIKENLSKNNKYTPT